MDTIESPIIMANVDDSNEPRIQGKYNKSIIIDRYERKIGIIGVVLSTYKVKILLLYLRIKQLLLIYYEIIFFQEIANVGNLKFFNESESVRTEAANLKKQGVDIIIVLSHCGLDVDYIIAKNAGSDIDVIVGGHTHTFMYTGKNPPGPDTPEAEYPAVVTQNDGHKVRNQMYFMLFNSSTIYI